MLIEIKHVNTYRYTQAVEFTPHWLMLRPAESHGLQIQSERIIISPAHDLRWKHDVFFNSVGLVHFSAKADTLVINSEYVVKQHTLNPFDFILEIYTNELPFDYRGDEAEDLKPYLVVQYPQDTASIRNWLSPYLNAKGGGPTLQVLLSINEAIATKYHYARRDEPGIQTPAQTIELGTGTCRDFALLMMEIARHLGLAARYVSGYLCGHGDETLEIASDATHAWCEIYLPGAGWKGFDPTNGTLAASYHVRVAATRNPAQATPIRGNYIGDASLFKGLEVGVSTKIL